MFARSSFLVLLGLAAIAGCARGNGREDAGTSPDIDASANDAWRASDALSLDGSGAGDAASGHDGSSQQLDAFVASDGGSDSATTCTPACGAGQTCSGGSCHCGAGPACSAIAMCCGGTCLDTRTSTSHCGSCTTTCATGDVCLAGTCTTPATCTPACATGETCVAPGTCQCGSGPACTGTEQCCGGTCVDTNTSAGNCGACGRVCTATSSCCSGNCVDTSTDVMNCGSCGHACNTTLANHCVASSCMCYSHAACLIMCVPISPFCFPA